MDYIKHLNVFIEFNIEDTDCGYLKRSLETQFNLHHIQMSY